MEAFIIIIAGLVSVGLALGGLYLSAKFVGLLIGVGVQSYKDVEVRRVQAPARLAKKAKQKDTQEAKQHLVAKLKAVDKITLKLVTCHQNEVRVLAETKQQLEAEIKALRAFIEGIENENHSKESF